MQTRTKCIGICLSIKKKYENPEEKSERSYVSGFQVPNLVLYKFMNTFQRMEIKCEGYCFS